MRVCDLVGVCVWEGGEETVSVIPRGGGSGGLKEEAVEEEEGLFCE